MITEATVGDATIIKGESKRRPYRDCGCIVVNGRLIIPKVRVEVAAIQQRLLIFRVELNSVRIVVERLLIFTKLVINNRPIVEYSIVLRIEFDSLIHEVKRLGHIAQMRIY